MSEAKAEIWVCYSYDRDDKSSCCGQNTTRYVRGDIIDRACVKWSCVRRCDPRHRPPLASVCGQRSNYGHAPHFAPCFELEPQTNDLAVLDNEIWLGERDYDLRMSSIDPDNACPAIVPFDLVRRRRA